MQHLKELVNNLIQHSNELPWLEFKHDNYDPEMIGRDISALANGAAFCDRTCAYMLWGVHDETHEIVGTNYDLQSLKKGNQELENWLRFLLSKNAEFEYHTVEMSDKPNNNKVGVLIIYRAANQTVTFEKVDYIRVGSYTKKLNEFPAMEATLWDKIRNTRFEERYAKQDLSLSEALSMLDCQIYFDLKGEPIPSTTDNIGHYMLEEQIISKLDNGLYAITNLGAISLAKNFQIFQDYHERL